MRLWGLVLAGNLTGGFVLAILHRPPSPRR